jgi:hypothetical protein
MALPVALRQPDKQPTGPFIKCAEQEASVP